MPMLTGLLHFLVWHLKEEVARQSSFLVQGSENPLSATLESHNLRLRALLGGGPWRALHPEHRKI